MKKLLTIIFMGACALTGAAQTDGNDLRADSLQQVIDEMNLKADREAINKIIWGKGRFTRLGYSWSQTADEFSPIEKSKYSFFLTKGTTYRFPKQPIAGLLKIGIDAIWFDAQFTKYTSPYDSQEWTSEFVTMPSAYDEDEDFDFDFNIGCMGASFAMGIGPNVSVAPFALTDINGLRPLRVSAYFHYSPTFQLYLKSNDGDVEISTAFCNMMNLGCTLTYRAIGIGYEARWGNGKFKPLDFESIIGDDDDSMDTQKYKRRFANNRLYIQFTF